MSQITKKFIADNAVDGAKIRLLNNQTLKARNAAGTADIDVLVVDGFDIVTFPNLPRAEDSLPIPNEPKQFATIEFVLDQVYGRMDPKDACDALADTNVALTGTGALVVDGFNFGVDPPISYEGPFKRVCLTGQTAPAENGMYDYVYDQPVPGDYTLSRSADFDASHEVTKGAYCFIMNGTVYSGYEAVLTTADPIVLGTTALTFAKYPSSTSMTAGDMLAKTGNDFSVDLATLSGLQSDDPGQPTGKLRIKADPAALEKDKTTKLDSGTNSLAVKKPKQETFTLGAGDITNGYVDLANVASQSSVQLSVAGGGSQVPGVDYTVNYTGGAGSKTRVTFAGGLAVAGASALVATDVVVINYESF